MHFFFNLPHVLSYASGHCPSKTFKNIPLPQKHLVLGKFEWGGLKTSLLRGTTRQITWWLLFGNKPQPCFPPSSPRNVNCWQAVVSWKVGNGTKVSKLKCTVFVALPEIQIFSCLNAPLVTASLWLIPRVLKKLILTFFFAIFSFAFVLFMDSWRSPFCHFTLLINFYI